MSNDHQRKSERLQAMVDQITPENTHPDPWATGKAEGYRYKQDDPQTYSATYPPVTPPAEQREAIHKPGVSWPGEWCKRCDRRNNVGFWVADEIWNAVSRGRWNVLCPACFDEEAEAAGVRYTFANPHEGLWPVLSWSDWTEEAQGCASFPPAEQRESARERTAREFIAAMDAELLPWTSTGAKPPQWAYQHAFNKLRERFEESR